MNGLTPQKPVPDFDAMVWTCPCCSQKRNDKYIKVMHHDVSALFGAETGAIVLNVKYCVDMPGCKEKAFSREWVINHFFQRFIKDEQHKIELPHS